MTRTSFALVLGLAAYAPSVFATGVPQLPEPGTFGLLVAGLVAAAVVTLRRRRK